MPALAGCLVKQIILVVYAGKRVHGGEPAAPIECSRPHTRPVERVHHQLPLAAFVMQATAPATSTKFKLVLQLPALHNPLLTQAKILQC